MTPIAVALIIFLIVLNYVIISGIKYNTAAALPGDGKYEEAISAFEASEIIASKYEKSGNTEKAILWYESVGDTEKVKIYIENYDLHYIVEGGLHSVYFCCHL